MLILPNTIRSFLPVIFICLTAMAYGQDGTNQAGARAAAMGDASATLADRWSVFNNPGGLGTLDETSFFAFYQNRFGIEGLSSLVAGATTKLPYGTLGIGAYRFGDDIYNEQMGSLAYSNAFGIASLGLRANYVQHTAEGFGTKSSFTLDFGGIAKLTDQLSVGAYIRNLNQAKLAEFNDQRIPTVLYAGLAYTPISKLIMAFEVEKDIDRDPRFKAGLEYQFLEKFRARTGIKTNSSVSYFGLSFNAFKLTIDYALSWQRTLGVSHMAGLAYKLR